MPKFILTNTKQIIYDLSGLVVVLESLRGVPPGVQKKSSSQFNLRRTSGYIVARVRIFFERFVFFCLFVSCFSRSVAHSNPFSSVALGTALGTVDIQGMFCFFVLFCETLLTFIPLSSNPLLCAQEYGRTRCVSFACSTCICTQSSVAT